MSEDNTPKVSNTGYKPIRVTHEQREKARLEALAKLPKLHSDFLNVYGATYYVRHSKGQNTPIVATTVVKPNSIVVDEEAAEVRFQIDAFLGGRDIPFFGKGNTVTLTLPLAGLRQLVFRLEKEALEKELLVAASLKFPTCQGDD